MRLDVLESTSSYSDNNIHINRAKIQSINKIILNIKKKKKNLVSNDCD